jgi:hypothetical protein
MVAIERSPSPHVPFIRPKKNILLLFTMTERGVGQEWPALRFVVSVRVRSGNRRSGAPMRRRKTKGSIMAKAIDVRVDSDGRTIVVYAPKRARGSKTFGVKGARVISQHARVGSGARYLYR